MIGTVLSLQYLPEENHETLRGRCGQYGKKLLKKADQAKLYCSVAHIYWHSAVPEKEGKLKDGAKVLQYLEKALSVTSQIMEDLTQLSLYVHVLSNYVYFYELGCDAVSIYL